MRRGRRRTRGARWVPTRGAACAASQFIRFLEVHDIDPDYNPFFDSRHRELAKLQKLSKAPWRWTHTTQQALEAASKEVGKGGVGGVSSSTPREAAKPPASGSAANERVLSEMLDEGTVIKRKKPKDESK